MLWRSCLTLGLKCLSLLLLNGLMLLLLLVLLLLNSLTLLLLSCLMLLLLNCLVLLLNRLMLLLNSLALLLLGNRLIMSQHRCWGSHITISRKGPGDGQISRPAMVGAGKLSAVGAGCVFILELCSHGCNMLFMASR